MIDGAYCADYAQLCPKTASKCVKISTTFIGPDLAGTPYPTVANCPDNTTAPTLLPNPAKPYLTPKDTAVWKGLTETCPAVLVSGRASRVPFVEQGMTAKPDIFPFFYSQLPTDVFPTACDWLGQARNLDLDVDAIFEVGQAAATGWARQNGYCA